MFSWESVIDREPRTGRWPIHKFARAGRWKTVRALAQRGVPLTVQDAFGYLPLHHAIISRDLNTVIMCLPRASPIGELVPVDMHARDSRTALHLAAKSGLPQILHAIVDYALWLVAQGSMPHARLLAFLNARTTDGKTAVALATIEGDMQAVNHLCAHRADADAPDAVLHSTPLHWAERLKDATAFRLLLAHGADLGAKNVEGRSPLATLDMGGQARSGGTEQCRHGAAGSARWPFGFEKTCARIDARYLLRRPRN